MKNKGLIGLHNKTSQSIEMKDFSPRKLDFANTAYGQIDTNGWSGLTRLNSLEGNFGGGKDPSNSAVRRKIIK